MISIEGTYDLHVHAAPSIARRRFTALEALKQASEEKMGGFLLLDHTYNTAMVAEVLNGLGYETRVFGSILLNEAVGGLNPGIVEVALAQGTKQIQMPTYSSKHHQLLYGDDQKIFPYKKRAKPAFILDEHGRLTPEVEEIIQLVKESESFLGTGHLSLEEIQALVGRAKEVKCKVLVNSVSTDMIDLPVDVQKTLADEHIFIEHDYMAVTDVPHRPMPIESVVEQIHAVGPERCVIGTDAGLLFVPDMISGMKKFISGLLENGLTDRELDFIARTNPRILLGIS
ncbi:MAG: DUF6282 family protein [Pseudomonadota bacterium]